MWVPTELERSDSNLSSWLKEHNFDSVAQLHQWSVDHRPEFWNAAIERLAIRFHKRPRGILNPNDGPENPHWLPGAELNIAESCFQAPAEATAIIFRGPNQPLKRWSYAHLHSRVRKSPPRLKQRASKKATRSLSFCR
jgi:acetyl-CoA synthetase